MKWENRPPYRLGVKVKEETGLSLLCQPPPLDQSWTEGLASGPPHPAWLAVHSGLPMEQSAGSLLAGMSGPRRSVPSQPGPQRLTAQLLGCEPPCFRARPRRFGGGCVPHPGAAEWGCGPPVPRSPSPRSPGCNTAQLTPPSPVLLQPLWRGTLRNRARPGVGPFPGRPGHRPLGGGC